MIGVASTISRVTCGETTVFFSDGRGQELLANTWELVTPACVRCSPCGTSNDRVLNYQDNSSC